MSVGLAMSRIGFYTQLYDETTFTVNQLQTDLITQTGQAQAPGPGQAGAQQQVADLRKKLAIALAIQGLAKEFLDYWKQVVKDFLSMMKSLQELAQGAR